MTHPAPFNSTRGSNHQMFRKVMTAVGLFMLAACGVDSQANVGGEEFEPELEISQDELVSSKVSAWFPLGECNTWTLKTSAGATRTVSFSDLESNVAWLDGMVPDGRWAGVATNAQNTLYTWDESRRWWDAFP